MHLCGNLLTILPGMTKGSSHLGHISPNNLFICRKSLTICSFAGGSSLAAICKKLEQLGDTLEQESKSVEDRFSHKCNDS